MYNTIIYLRLRDRLTFGGVMVLKVSIELPTETEWVSTWGRWSPGTTIGCELIANLKRFTQSSLQIEQWHWSTYLFIRHKLVKNRTTRCDTQKSIPSNGATRRGIASSTTQCKERNVTSHAVRCETKKCSPLETRYSATTICYACTTDALVHRGAEPRVGDN